jgi:hypothetical protein
MELRDRTPKGTLSHPVAIVARLDEAHLRLVRMTKRLNLDTLDLDCYSSEEGARVDVLCAPIMQSSLRLADIPGML